MNTLQAGRLTALIVVFILATGSLFCFATDQNVPATLKDRYDAAGEAWNSQVSTINALQEKNSVMTKEEWGKFVLRTYYAVSVLHTVPFAVKVCEVYSLGDYCDRAGDALTVFEKELKWLKEVVEKYNGKFI